MSGVLRGSRTPQEGESCVGADEFPRTGDGGRTRYGSSVDSVRVLREDGTVLCARCAVASNPWTRLRGLLGRSALDADEGLLIRPTNSIHMMFMRFPIDAVFVDRELRVLDVRTVAPWRFAAKRGSKAVLELAAGAGAGLRVGEQLALD